MNIRHHIALRRYLLAILFICVNSGAGVLAADVDQGDQKIFIFPPSEISFKDVEDLIWGDNQFVAVGTYGLVMTSPDGRMWKIQRRNKTSKEWLRGVAWGNSRYVAIDLRGVFLTSSDGITWDKHRPAAAVGISLTRVAWANNQFVVVGVEGLILTSPNGIDWTRQDSGTAEYLKGIAGGNGKFVVVGEHGTVLTSPDGKEWTGKTLEGKPRLYSVAWSGQEFVAVGSGLVARSLDGQEWEVKEFFGANRNMSDITWNGTHFVAVGADVLISTDGKEWTFLNAGAPATGYWLNLKRVAGKTGLYAVIGSRGEVYISSDGMTWRGGDSALPINRDSGQVRIPDKIAQTSPVDEATELKHGKWQEIISGGLIGFAMSGGSLLFYMLLQVWLIKRMKRAWRVFAALPLVPVTIILVLAFTGFSQGANLWPLGIIFFVPLAFVYLVLLLALYALLKILRRKSISSPNE